MSFPDPRAAPLVLASGMAPETVRVVREALARAGISFDSAATARDLLAANTRLRPDILLVDTAGGEAAALELCRVLASTPPAERAPVVVLADEAQAGRALESGADDIVERPLRVTLLPHRLRRALAHREALVELERVRERLDAAAGDRGLTATAERSRVDHDTLTGLPNRDRFLRALALAIDAARTSRELVALLYLEIDLGHILAAAPGARDPALVALAARLRETVRDRDTVGHLGARLREVSLARIGGERFAVLLPGLARPQDAYKVARRIQEAIGRPLEVGGCRACAPACFGIAIHPSDGESASVVLDAAEIACRRAREEEAGGIRYSADAMNASAFERLTLEASLQRALERDELFVHYQPRVEIATGRIAGMEALCRWQHPELGLVSPARFIPIAEETGLIVPIGERVLAIACQQSRRWRDAGIAPIRMAVNLSSVQFREPDLSDRIAATLREARLEPDGLELELTESVLLSHTDATVARLEELKRTGVHLSIDDFGTGYSSLSYLKRFPIDALKIDQSFIRDVTTDADDAAITTSILLMGRSLGLKVVAEGVETARQLEFLRVLGCDEAQGFYFSRPVAPEDAGRLIAKGFGASAAA